MSTTPKHLFSGRQKDEALLIGLEDTLVCQGAVNEGLT